MLTKFRWRHNRDLRLRLLREFAASSQWQVVALVDDLRLHYPVPVMRSAISARAELAVRGPRAGTEVLIASVLVRQPPESPGRRGPEAVVVLAAAAVPGPRTPIVADCRGESDVQLSAGAPGPLAAGLRSATAQGLLRAGESVVWSERGLAHLARAAHLDKAALDRRLELIDMLVGSLGGVPTSARNAPAR